MKIVTQRGTPEPLLQNTAIALGYFDGVHKGHQQVIGTAQAYARTHGLALAVFTFTSSGKTTKKGLHLLNEEQKHEALYDLGVEYCFEPSFESFCSLTPEEFFMQMLKNEYKAKAVFCGNDFAFGTHRSGNVELLQKMCDANGVHLGVVPLAEYEGEVVSSSRIRAALSEGDIPAVNAMLGYPYEVRLPVQRGQGLGHTLGFPTLNQIYPADLQPPREGVYITQTVLDNKIWPSATGYGNRPTVNGVGDTCETFIPGFSGNLYGMEIRVRFFERLSGNIKFETLEELRMAVQKWAKEAVAYFEEK